MSVVVVTPPPAVLTLEMVKRHLRVEHGDDDLLIGLYLAAAQGSIDGPSGWLGRCIGAQELELRLDGFATPIWGWSYDHGGLFWDSYPEPGSGWNCRRGQLSRIDLPCPPLISVEAVTYEDAAGAVQTLPSSAYLATDEGLDPAYGTWFPTGRWEANAVRVRYRAGYEQPPAPVVAAILLMIGDLYDNRATVETGVRAAAVAIPMSTTVQALLAPYRVYGR